MDLLGIHHLSAMTADAKGNVDFYTKILGMRMVKKTVNQDDPSVYHLFYGDEIGHPGTELTFFEIPRAGQNHNGNQSISTTSLRVPNDEALEYWEQRLTEHDVEHEGIVEQYGRKVLPFKDFENQRLILVSDEQNRGVAGGTPWNKSAADPKYGIIGLGPIHLTIPNLEPTEAILTKLMGFRRAGEYQHHSTGKEVIVFETGEGGTGAELHIHVRTDLPPERLGRGGVHHVAFRVENEEKIREYLEQLNEIGIGNSGFVDRFYFRSVYFREPNGILFELATDGPGFDTDEDAEHLGESLALPPFLEPRREEIEGKLKPID
ncbi:ring-cleaving dioxygenase [Tenuibacillus multivorans]|uniref:Glyoxalase family protein n=1 Tax=Tenuibacillus multivorans TaxID=237069 RepID=A0A1H0B5X5_9BACI|nr:ring-cleaving dioxygenase [Tenuibacillus multivorans]GEL78632.1 putative ring-cleaving dioxygenase MhqA [Tenuibacillus multivorans]SDN41036.1 glyoxalase family protein [Tenuibacillus multivorans]